MKIFFASIVALTVLSVGFLIWSSFTGTAPAPAVPIEGVQKYTHKDSSHTTDKVTYSEIPPTGGNHAPMWAACNGNVYDKPLPNEQAVHSLEHGAVWITYQPSVDTAQIATLSKKVQGHLYAFMSPFPEQKSPIVLTAWGNQLSVQTADDSRIDQFVKQFSQGRQTPEPGASCAAVSGGMQ